MVDSIIKLIANGIHTISGLFLDDTPENRLRFRQLATRMPHGLIGVPYTTVAGQSSIAGSLAGVRALDGVRALGDETQPSLQEEVATTALYEVQRALHMNNLIKELPFISYDEFVMPLEQSYSVTIPSNTSLVQINYCCPIMNFGNQFQTLINDFYVYKVTGIELTVNLQNQLYSTQTIAYDPVISADDIASMQRDLTNLSLPDSDMASAATGHMVHYFTTDINDNDPGFDINGKRMGTTSEYLRVLSEIKKLDNATQFPNGTPGQMGVTGPSFRLVAMRPDHVSNPVQQDSNSFLAFDAARGFFDKMPVGNTALFHVEQMPVFGKFYYTLSNTFEKTVDLITGIKCVVVCKRRKSSGGYLPPAMTN